MSKRSHRESAAGSLADPSERVLKRTKSEVGTDALQLILENANDLIDCIRNLQSENAKDGSLSSLKLDAVEPSSKQSLCALSQKLLPAFQDLANKPQQDASKVEDKPPPQIPPLAIVTKWTTSTLAKSPPPLPDVLDPALAVAALTHSGKTNKPTDPSYERLEWIGDAYVYVIASSLVYQTFPSMDPGRCSQFREVLIRNSTLCTFTQRYGLDKRANFPEEFGLQGRAGGTSASDKQRQKVMGDIFEAYVGAVILSDPQNGVQRAADWLKALWGPVLEKDIRKEESRVPTTSQIMPKTELERAISVKGIKIEYKDIPTSKKDNMTKLPLFMVGCFLTGWGETDKQLGYGNALNKKDAGNRAAQMALENRKLIKTYIDKKKAYMEARAAQAAAAEAAGEQHAS